MAISKEAKTKYDKEYRLRNLAKRKAQQAAWYQENKEHKKQYDIKYRIENKDYINKRHLHKKRTCPEYKLKLLLRNRLIMALKKSYKTGSAVSDLGCSIEALRLHLESKFKPGMTWDNWGIKGWHIDHIVPLSFFNLQDREQFLRAVHFSNLQPLWSWENLSKSSKIIEENIKCP